MDRAVSVVGLGKLGLGLALCLADSGFETIGIDLDKSKVEKIGRGESPYPEPLYSELLLKEELRLRVSQDYFPAIYESDLTFILVPTPSKSDGSFSDEYVLDVLTKLARVLGKSQKAFHTFVICSTVSPGSMRRFCDCVKRESGRQAHGFGLCFNPEFVALGTVIRDFRSPDMVVIGSDNFRSSKEVEEVHKSLCDKPPTFVRTSFENAELIKLSLNTFLTIKIGFANTLLAVCNQIEGADVDVVTQALGQDRRISAEYFKGGLPYGGPCFPRDTQAFIHSASALGIQANLVEAAEEVNEAQYGLIVDFIIGNLGTGQSIGVVGLAFKENANLSVHSPTLELVEKLIGLGVSVTAYDSIACDDDVKSLGPGFALEASVSDCLESVDICVAPVLSDYYKQAIQAFEPKSKLVVLDCWRQIDSKKCHFNVEIRTLGVSRWANRLDS